MTRILIFSILTTLLSGASAAQSTAYVFKGGLSLGTQKWESSNRELLFKPFGAIAIETIDNEEDKGSLFVQAGYHVKGSATRFFLTNGTGLFSGSEEVTFTNFSLLFGAKMKKPFRETNKLYYFGGIRGDYTWKTNIDNLGLNYNYLFIGGVQRWMAGLSLGGGLQFDFTDLIGGQIELSVNPDLTAQYKQPGISRTLPNGEVYSYPQQRIKNTTIELSFGLRLLRKVVYEN